MLEEEVITNLEFGVKANLDGNQVALTSAISTMDWRNIGEQFLDDVELMALPVTQTLNASVNFRNDNWDLRIYGRNLTDNDTPRRVSEATDYNQIPNNSNFWFIPRDPREIGVNLTYSL